MELDAVIVLGEGLVSKDKGERIRAGEKCRVRGRKTAVFVASSEKHPSRRSNGSSRSTASLTHKTEAGSNRSKRSTASLRSKR